jgi:hypothetical protein
MVHVFSKRGFGVAENVSINADGVLRRTRRRVRFRAVLAGLGVVFTFLLLAAAAGFGYGMWEEVDVAPMKYAEQTSEKDAAALELWSVETGKWIAAVQGYEAKPPPGELAMAERPDPPSQPKPELRDTSRPRQTPVEPAPM